MYRAVAVTLTALAIGWAAVCVQAETIVIDGAKSIKLGDYTIALNGAAAVLDTDAKTLTLSTPMPGPGPGPEPGPGPGPPDLSDLGKSAYAWTKAVGAPASEVRAFAAAYRQTAANIKSAVAAGVPLTAEQCVKMLADNVGTLATPAFRERWGKWSESYKAAMVDAKLSGAEQHAKAWTEIAEGMESAAK